MIFTRPFHVSGQSKTAAVSVTRSPRQGSVGGPYSLQRDGWMQFGSGPSYLRLTPPPPEEELEGGKEKEEGRGGSEKEGGGERPGRAQPAP